MENLIILHHLGMGDMLSISPAVRYFAKKYKQVYIFCKKNYFDNTMNLYYDVENINIVQIDSEETDIPNFIKNFWEKFDIVKAGIFNPDRQNFVNLPDNFYIDLNLPLSTYDEEFYLPENVIDNTVFDKIKNQDYVFVSGSTSIKDYNNEILSKIKTDKLILNPSINCYNKGHKYYEIAELVIDLPLFDYVNIMKYAKEIHVVGHLFSILGKFVCSNDTIKVIHNLSKINLSNNFWINWKIIEY